MLDKVIKQPSADHPITIEPAASRVVVTVGGRVVADTRAALVMREAKYPAVHYIPLADVTMSLFRQTATASYCPYKGDCAYYDVEGGAVADVAWAYEDPYPAVAAIRGHLAFYPDRVDSIAVTP